MKNTTSSGRLADSVSNAPKSDDDDAAQLIEEARRYVNENLARVMHYIHTKELHARELWHVSTIWSLGESEGCKPVVTMREPYGLGTEQFTISEKDLPSSEQARKWLKGLIRAGRDGPDWFDELTEDPAILL